MLDRSLYNYYCLQYYLGQILVATEKLLKILKFLSNSYATFNLENLNLINNSNVNAKNVYFSKIKPITPSFSIFDL